MFYRKLKSLDFLEYRAEGNGINQPLPYSYIRISHIQKNIPPRLVGVECLYYFCTLFRC